MNLTMLPMVNRHVERRKQLQHQLDVVTAWTGDLVQGPIRLGLTIDGERQDCAMVALVRPAIQRELQAQLAQVDRDLEQLGVSIDGV